MTTRELPVRADRERLADRLLRSTAARSYDPELDIDWSAPAQEDKLFLPEHRSTLCGTAIWERLSPDQRRELGRHEAASVAGFGIWLECILMRLLTKLADAKPRPGPANGGPCCVAPVFLMAGRQRASARCSTGQRRRLEQLNVVASRAGPHQSWKVTVIVPAGLC